MGQEPPKRVERRLAAILAADVAGYSRLMHSDEEATHAKLSALLADSVTPAIAEHGGRIVKNTGDGFLAEFPSAVAAVRAALRFQIRVNEQSSVEVEDRRIAFRVGINIGDVIVEVHDIFGDGVNIAARLESIAEPGGICISSSAYDQVRGKVGVEFTDLGEQNLKNIALRVRTYAAILDGRSPKRWDGSLRPIQLSPPHLSIVVLPFTNLSGDPEQDYFVDGVTESLTTDLSHIPGSFVIARNSAFSYKGKPVDVRQVGRELNIRYVLEGSVQRYGNRLQVNVQLIDAETGNHLWAERFGKSVADLFDMQDEIVSRLANTLGFELVTAEASRAERSPHPDSMDLYFQGLASWHKGFVLENLLQALGFFERALTLDPDNIGALVGTAQVNNALGAGLLTNDRVARLATAEAALLKALSIAPNYDLAHLILGIVLMFTKRPAQGIAECERALALNRNIANAYAFIGLAKCALGHAEEAEAYILEALRLSPRDVFAYQWMTFAGTAKLLLQSDADAVAWLQRGIKLNRNFPSGHFNLAAALALSGSLGEARATALAGVALNPGFTIRAYRDNAMSDNPTYLAGRERIFEGMRMAGVPEG
jgi:TolB-like protein/class 3 adenylate cyclase/Flp pilus assembly protein TadD